MPETITVYRLPDLTDASQVPPGLADIWPRLQPILQHWLRFSQNEAGVREHQLGMVRDGCFLMPSPFGEGGDRCLASFCFDFRFFYRFQAKEDYFWVTSLLARGYCLSSIFLPRRAIAIDLFPDAAPADLYGSFAATYGTAKTNISPDVIDASPAIAVTGFHHPMHVLWNELPALDAAVASPPTSQLKVAVRYEPFGPTESLFPELASCLTRVNTNDIFTLNISERFLVGLGSRTITAATQNRVRTVAEQLATPPVLNARERFRADHWPILWVSIKPPHRTPIQQVAMLVKLLERFQEAYPRSGFLVDGASFPWDYDRSDAYGTWFRDYLWAEKTESAAIIVQLLHSLPPSIRAHVASLNGLTMCQEIAWGEAADFYFCHGGTMQNKIGWIHRIPGMLHSNTSFMSTYSQMYAPVENGIPCQLLPADLVLDDDLGSYSDLQLARRDKDYQFTSLEEVVSCVLLAFRESEAKDDNEHLTLETT
jgi:hypothetical protein